MAVNGVSAAGSTTAAAASSRASVSDAKDAALDYDSFLTLLIAQMRNQDPTDPMDSSEQIAQLATFSQVEQSIKTNSNLENLISMTSLNGAASYIGKTITSQDGKTSGVISSIKVSSDGMVATTTTGKKITIDEGVTIRDTSIAAPTEAATVLGQTLTSSDGKTTGKVAAVTLASDGAYATTTEGTTLPIAAEMEISNTVASTGLAGSYFLGKRLTSADGQTSGVVESVSLTANGVFAMTVTGKNIAIVQGVSVQDTTS